MKINKWVSDNSIELIDINKLYDGFNEKLIAIDFDDFNEIVNNSIVKEVPIESDDDKKKPFTADDIQ